MNVRKILAVSVAAAVVPAIGLTAGVAEAASAQSVTQLATANIGKGAGTCSQSNSSLNSLGGSSFLSSCAPQYWCADFAEWVYGNAGLSTAGLTPAAGSFITGSSQNGSTVHTSPAYVPTVGDAVVYDYSNGTASHVGLVTSVNSDGSVTTVNGDWDGDSGSQAQFAETSTVVSFTISASQRSVGSQPTLAYGKTISAYVTPAGLTSLAGVHQIYGDSNGWHDQPTPLTVPAGTTMATLDMGGSWPQVMADENGSLHQIWGDSNGWHDQGTTISVPVGTQLSAVRIANGAWPQVMAIESGRLHQIYGDSNGWHDLMTSVVVPAGTTMSAVDMGGSWPQVMADENGQLHQISGDSAGWHDVSTAVTMPASTAVSAVDMGGTWPEVMAVEGGQVHQIYGDSAGWHDASTGVPVPSTTTISAVDMGGAWPQVMANENGTLHQIFGASTGWHDVSTGSVTFSSGDPFGAVDMGGTWPQVMTLES